LIVIDASALVAIGHKEADRIAIQEALASANGGVVAPVNYVETGIILLGRRFQTSQAQLDAWLTSMRVFVRSDLDLGPAALNAYLRYGKGFHPARLNLADCFAYALAKMLDAPLLYKGDDFAKTDIRSAL
jgi:ribonuclease VapC